MSENINDKNFSEETDTIYRESIEIIRSNISNGAHFDHACELITVQDKKLKDLIIDDALKIEIAELHYGKGLPFTDVSKKLCVSMERLVKANTEMIDDIQNTAVEIYERQSGNQGLTTQ